MGEGGLLQASASDAGRHVPEAVALARRIAAAYGALPRVVAVALGGSRVGGKSDAHADARSDIDLYVFAETPPSLAARAAVAAGGTGVELDNRFWETEDGWTDAATGLDLDVIFRSPSWIDGELERLLVRHEAATGYSTCIWHNVRYAVPFADPTGWFDRLQATAAQPYPEPLRRAIIAKNHPILRDARNAYRKQIAVALARGDAVSVLPGHGDVVHAGATAPELLRGSSRERRARVDGAEEVDRRRSGDGERAMRVAGEGKGAVGEQEQDTTVDRSEAVEHVVAHRHPHRCAAGREVHELDAEHRGRGVGGEHRLRR